jgi:CYTH domain-containing protein
MKMEIERKFLLESIYKYPYNNLKFIKAYSILQGYFLNDEKYEFRIRLIKNNNKFEKAFLTIKSKNYDISREEYEFTLNVEEAFDFLENQCTDYVFKTRTLYQYDDKTIEFNCFLLNNKQCCIIEVEFDSEEEANQFDYKTILGDTVIEVTGNPDYYSRNMTIQLSSEVFEKLKKKMLN